MLKTQFFQLQFSFAIEDVSIHFLMEHLQVRIKYIGVLEKQVRGGGFTLGGLKF